MAGQAGGRLCRYWHTLRYLKPVQFYGRLWFRLARPKPDTAAAPALRAISGKWQAPAQRSASLLSAREFCFLGERGVLDAVGWDGPAREKLWRYNQHYFDDLNAASNAGRVEWHQALLVDWVKHNPPGKGGNGWEPYPTSLRIVNWVKWALAGNSLPDVCVQSLAVQARWLTKRLEIHLLGNHLFANAKALVFAGVFFKGPEADGWLAKGMQILAREVPEQILADGGHFERSTMYHVLALEDMLDLWNVVSAYPQALAPSQQAQVKTWPGHISRMQTWLHALCHPDGEISFFNDAAFGIAPTVAEMGTYARRFDIAYEPVSDSAHWLKDTGYARLARGSAVALLDMAPVGPDYLPGHAHADTLSFELSLFGQRVFVNSGTSCYGLSAERLRQRGTAAHNTVLINGQDSSEVWGGFRVARRARPMDCSITKGGHLTATAAHDGYRRLPGSPVHRRAWHMHEDKLVIEDSIAGRYDSAEARFHFHPQVELLPGESASAGECVLPDGSRFFWQVEQGNSRIETSSWHPRFGESQTSHCLAVNLHEGRGRLVIRWA